MRSIFWMGVRKMMIYCKICGAECIERDKIEARKGTYYDVCSDCFNKTLSIPVKDIIKLISKSSL